MKLTLKSHSNTRQVATDIYTVKYQTYLLQVLCDNLDSAVLDYLAPIDRLRMTATYETRLKLGNILRLAKSLPHECETWQCYMCRCRGVVAV